MWALINHPTEHTLRCCLHDTMDPYLMMELKWRFLQIDSMSLSLCLRAADDVTIDCWWSHKCITCVAKIVTRARENLYLYRWISSCTLQADITAKGCVTTDVVVVMVLVILHRITRTVATNASVVTYPFTMVSICEIKCLGNFCHYDIIKFDWS